MRDIEIDLAGRTFRLLGESNPISEFIGDALTANGALPSSSETADLLIVVRPLVPLGAGVPSFQLGEAVSQIGKDGRVVLLLSAIASLPARGYASYSAAMAAALAEMRALAIERAPGVLINAVGIGEVEQAGHIVAGDRRMLGHASVARPGRIADVVNAVLFLCDPDNTYTTGQILNVDGGWSVGYGRNF